jgi:hypothetical protein
MSNPTPTLSLSLSLGLGRYKEKMATPERETFCVLQFVKHDSQLFLFSGHSGENFRVIPHLPTALAVDISSFRKWGAIVKGKVQDVHMCQKKMWNE